MIYIIYSIIAILALLFSMRKDKPISNIIYGIGIIGVLAMPYLIGGS